MTIRPEERFPFAYEKGKPRKFMMTGYNRPTQRGIEIIRRVEARRRMSHPGSDAPLGE